MSEPVLISLVGGGLALVQGITVALISLLTVRLGRTTRQVSAVRADVAATKENVVNDHSTNMREEQDQRFAAQQRLSQSVLTEVQGLAEDLRGTRADVRGLRRDVGRLSDASLDHEERLRMQELHDLERTEGGSYRRRPSSHTRRQWRDMDAERPPEAE